MGWTLEALSVDAAKEVTSPVSVLYGIHYSILDIVQKKSSTCIVYLVCELKIIKSDNACS